MRERMLQDRRQKPQSGRDQTPGERSRHVPRNAGRFGWDGGLFDPSP